MCSHQILLTCNLTNITADLVQLENMKTEKKGNYKMHAGTLFYIYFSLIVINSKANAIQARSDKEQQQTLVSGTSVQSVVPVAPPPAAPTSDFNPLGPKVMCSFLPRDFLDCKDPIDHNFNSTAKLEKGYGCLKFGGSNYEDVEHTKVQCTVFPDIDCYGPRTFFRDGEPCVRYTDHYFVTTLIYSILLGFLGMDRFCLGQTGTAVGKLLTVGGVGVWWVVDVILLVSNNLLPEDGSNWNPYV